MKKGIRTTAIAAVTMAAVSMSGCAFSPSSNMNESAYGAPFPNEIESAYQEEDSETSVLNETEETDEFVPYDNLNEEVYGPPYTGG